MAPPTGDPHTNKGELSHGNLIRAEMRETFGWTSQREIPFAEKQWLVNKRLNAAFQAPSTFIFSVPWEWLRYMSLRRFDQETFARFANKKNLQSIVVWQAATSCVVLPSVAIITLILIQKKKENKTLWRSPGTWYKVSLTWNPSASV